MDYQMVPEDGQGMPERTPDPAGAILAGDPRSPAPAASRYTDATVPGSAAGEPGADGETDAERPLAVPAPRAEPGPGQPVHHLPPRTAHAGTTSRRCSSTIRAPLLSWRPASSTPASRRWWCRSRSGRSRCCPPGRATMQEPRSCARRSSSTARSGTASKISPVKLERPLAGQRVVARLVRLGYTIGTVICVFS